MQRVAGTNASGSPEGKPTPPSSGVNTPKTQTTHATSDDVKQASNRLNDALSSSKTADAAMSLPAEPLQKSAIEAGDACEVCLQDNEHVMAHTSKV